MQSIAIDGPVGAGKSTVARDVAARLHFLHLDTGAMYRALAWAALEKGIDPQDEAAVIRLSETDLPEVRFVDGRQQTWILGKDVSPLIRTPEVSMAASTLSKSAAIRAKMVELQQEIARHENMVLEGRDIGTVVLPHATLKIYLTASPLERATRRFNEMKARGEETTLDEVLRDVTARDEQDINREASPLRRAEDAQLLDSTGLTQEQVVQEVIDRLTLLSGKRLPHAEPFTPFYRFFSMVTRGLMKTLFPFEVTGLEYTAAPGPYLLIANHTHFMDPFLLGCHITNYQVRFMGKKELANNAFTKWFFKGFGMITVERGASDMAALRAALKTLKEGHALGIFPEGTRYKKGVMDELESGIAMIALRSGCRLQPAYITGSPRLFKKNRVVYAPPIPVDDLRREGINTETCEKLLERVREVYREMTETWGSEKLNLPIK